MRRSDPRNEAFDPSYGIFDGRADTMVEPLPTFGRRVSSEILGLPPLHRIPLPSSRINWNRARPPPHISDGHRIPSPSRDNWSRARSPPHISERRRFPSPPRESEMQRVPSPPSQPNQRRNGQRKVFRPTAIRPKVSTEEPRIDPRSRGEIWVSEDQRAPSHPPRGPTPPSFEPHRHSFSDRNLPRPGTPLSPYPRISTGLLSLPDGADYSLYGGYGPQGLKRWNSERTPKTPGSVTPTQSTGQPWSKKPTASVAPSESTFMSSLPPSPGVLGDQAYQYTALQGSQFRLLRVFPERKTMIKCEIIHTSLEYLPRYVAISYAWGDAGNTRRIELKGSLIPIGVNLYGALEALRQKAKSVLVWVDALCIDQQNKDERTQQVRLMTSIYSTAESVAIWLGPEEDDSALAIDLLRTVVNQADSPAKVSRLISSQVGKRDLAAVVSLFERDYWRRLWVVQEIFNARSITVYCGSTQVPWSVYQLASHAFSQHRDDLDQYFPAGKRDGRRHTISLNQFSYSQVLVYQGPGSLPDLRSYMGLGEESLLGVLRACRRKLASDAKDKLFGILGVLPEEARGEFRADYNLSVKEVYTEIVDYLLKTTECVDVICEAIHFPIHTGSVNLPSYVPDWSHIPQTAAMGHKYRFSAAGKTKANCRFLDERLNRLEISAIYLDTISMHGIAVGTLCTLGDYLMAFLHWRALLLGSLENENDQYSLLVQQDFCRTLSLGQVPVAYDRPKQWLIVCYHVFASLLRDRLPHLPLDRTLRDHVDAKVDIKPEARRQFLQKHFGDQMMGRCFCCTGDGRIGMGSGFMLPGDVIVVPLGCSTPILLRLEGTRGEYRFVGDIYINGYMGGRAVDELKDGKRDVRKYVLH